MQTQARMETLTLQEVLTNSELIADLRTDDGYKITEVTTRFGDVGTRSRSNWVRDLLQTFSSEILNRISQRLTLTTAWSAYIAAVILYGDVLAPEAWDVTQFRVPGWPHELVGGFLSILVVFRTDQAYGRFWEARQHWAACSADCKSMTRLALANLPPQLSQEFVALLAVFPTALKQHLRGYVNKAELAAIYHLYIPPPGAGEAAAAGPGDAKAAAGRDGYIDMVVTSKNMPMTVTLCLSKLAAPLRDKPSARVHMWMAQRRVGGGGKEGRREGRREGGGRGGGREG
jgi:hypothetical protein